MAYQSGELIDTLWNVNPVSESEASDKHLGINRYTLECK